MLCKRFIGETCYRATNLANMELAHALQPLLVKAEFVEIIR
jgi:hypothetical protein